MEEEKVIIEENNIVPEEVSNDENKNVDTSVSDKKKTSNILITVLKRHKIIILLLILFTTLSSTMAWFIYNTTVDMSLQAHVKTWNVYLGEGGVDGVYEFKISDLYPGMADVTDNVDIVNNGEVSASVAVDIKKITLFGVEQVEGVDYTLEIANNGTEFIIKGYPFNLIFYLGNTALASGGKSAMSFNLTWDYDNDTDPNCTVDATGMNSCDLLDTQFGERAYAFSSNPDNEGKSSLVIDLALDIVQTGL